jgi:cytochrome P450
MTLVSELELGSFDYTDPGMYGARFHQAMRELRAEGWLASGPFGYIVLDREAGEFFLRTRAASFPGMKIAEIFGVTEGPLWEQMKRNILHVNGADHSRLRGLVNPALSPRAVERYRPMMRGFLEDLLARAAAASAAAPASASAAATASAASSPAAASTPASASAPASATASSASSPAAASPAAAPPAAASSAPSLRCDFVEAFAKPYPSQTIASVMGAPIADAPKLHHWSNWIQKQFDAASMASERAGIERAVEEFYEYARELVRARREDPGDDLISTLIAAEEAGDKLSDVECINLVFNVLAGGVDTTQSQLAHAIRLLAEHPEQWAALRADPSLAPAAVEEALRYEPITPFTARITNEEVTFRDVTFPEGTIVMVCAFTGNRDAGEASTGVHPPTGAHPLAGDGDEGDITTWTGAHPPDGDGDEFDITAWAGAHPAARALTFGAGVHYCLGANLARVELQEALAFLAERFESLALDGEPQYESITGIYGLGKLPVRLLP